VIQNFLAKWIPIAKSSWVSKANELENIQMQVLTYCELGKHPQWNQTLSFRRTNEYMIEIQVWDADEVSNDDLVGEGSLAL
jgi:hypothetical protein